MRTGVIARKMGMTRMFTEEGEHVPVTVLKMENCQVVAVRRRESDGYDAVQLGAGTVKAKNVSRAMRGHFAKAKVPPKRYLAEFRVDPEGLIEPGQELSPEHFLPGQYVDVSGTTIGKGFSGVMKRHNFSGQRASHGVSISHRKPGSTGNSQDPGKVFKGKKMAGQYGHERVTVQCLRVVATDPERDLIMVRGAVPGADGGWVRVADSVKRKAPEGLPFPAGLKQSGQAAAEAEAPAPEAEAAKTEDQ